jgi:hypothetical protein
VSTRRWIQNPLPPYNLIPRDEYVRPKELRHAIFGDIDSFVSPVDGSVITGRKALEEHNRKHGVVNAAEFSVEYCEQKAKERNAPPTRREVQKRREHINEVINTLERNPNLRPRIQEAEYDHRE